MVVGVLANARQLPAGSSRAGDRHLKIHDYRDNLYLLTVGLHSTGGALLGNVGEGWAEPLTWDNELPGCTEPHLLWHLELAQWPDDGDLQRLAFRVGDHIEEAWGTASRRYLARRGELVGRLDVRQLHQ